LAGDQPVVRDALHFALRSTTGSYVAYGARNLPTQFGDIPAVQVQPLHDVVGLGAREALRSRFAQLRMRVEI
jgi:hypothetical protein